MEAERDASTDIVAHGRFGAACPVPFQRPFVERKAIGKGVVACFVDLRAAGRREATRPCEADVRLG